jgi:hypothetical protein
MKVSLLIFASNEKYLKPTLRLKRQAKCLNVFDNIVVIEPQSFPKEFKIFLGENQKFFGENKRGYGYWIWKPFLVDWMLNNNMSSNDILVYMDSGCEVSKFGKDELLKYINMTISTDGLFFNTKFKELNWTKSDLIEHFNAHHLINKKQIQATFFFLKNTPNARSMVSSWLNTARKDNYHYLDDSDSILKNFKGFVEHRHDQSILSLLVKKNKFTIIDCDFLFYSRLYYVNSYLLKYPIHALRNLSDDSRLDEFMERSDLKQITSFKSFIKLKSLILMIKIKEILNFKIKF